MLRKMTAKLSCARRSECDTTCTQGSIITNRTRFTWGARMTRFDDLGLLAWGILGDNVDELLHEEEQRGIAMTVVSARFRTMGSRLLQQARLSPRLTFG